MYIYTCIYVCTCVRVYTHIQRGREIIFPPVIFVLRSFLCLSIHTSTHTHMHALYHTPWSVTTGGPQFIQFIPSDIAY